MKFLICVLSVCIGIALGQDTGTNTSMPTIAPSPVAPTLTPTANGTSSNCSTFNSTTCCEKAATFKCVLVTCNSKVQCLEESKRNSSVCDNVDLCAPPASTPTPATTRTPGNESTSTVLTTPSTVLPTISNVSTTSSTSTNVSVTTTSATVPIPTSTNATTAGSTVKPTEKAVTCGARRFDTASFVGGIILCAAILIAAFVGYRVYRRKHNTETPYSQF